MRGATKIFPTMQRRSPISIHAPHAGRDGVLGPCSYQNTYFNPRAPCGARPHVRDGQLKAAAISIHAPHAGRDPAPRPGGIRYNISIHAPHAGRDARHSNWTGFFPYFNPRAPCGARRQNPLRRSGSCGISIHAPHAGRDADREASKKWNEISIHAPHAGRDPEPVAAVNTICNFNPRAPCGARLGASLEDRDAGKFQSTRPMRGATWSLP